MTTQEQVKDVVSQVLADKADKGGIKRVVWIGAGGSNGGNYPAQYFMEHEATQVVSSSYTSNEFVHATPAYVNENTLAVVVSMRGTKETIVAAQVAKDHGASTIAIYVDESGLTEVCDYKIQYDSLAVDESCMGRTNSAVVTMIAMELTQQTEGYAEYETAMAAFDLVDPIYRKAVEYTRPLAAKWAEQNADKPCINVMAQGPLFGAAYVFSICNVQEMLQIDSCTINTCDFFHGPFEILDKRTSLFQLISVGRSRCNDERGIRFVNQYGPTEATASCTYYVVPGLVEDTDVLPIGKPYPHYEVFLLSEQNEAVPDGEIGEICVKGPILALGYYNSREKTAESFLQNPLNRAYDERIYKTGDLGHFAPDGNLMFHGRKDRQVKHLGHRVELGEIDLAAAKVSGVEEACALYDQEHEQIWLFYTGADVTKRDIAVALRADLPGFMVPRKIEQLEAMPRLDNGKTDMRALAGRIADAHR